MYNGLLRFNKHILNELAEGLKHLPNLDQDTDKAVCVLMLGDGANNVSGAGSGGFHSFWTRSQFRADTGFFTTVKLD